MVPLTAVKTGLQKGELRTQINFITSSWLAHFSKGFRAGRTAEVLTLSGEEHDRR